MSGSQKDAEAASSVVNQHTQPPLVQPGLEIRRCVCTRSDPQQHRNAKQNRSGQVEGEGQAKAGRATIMGNVSKQQCGGKCRIGARDKYGGIRSNARGDRHSNNMPSGTANAAMSSALVSIMAV